MMSNVGNKCKAISEIYFGYFGISFASYLCNLLVINLLIHLMH